MEHLTISTRVAEIIAMEMVSFQKSCQSVDSCDDPLIDYIVK